MRRDESRGTTGPGPALRLRRPGAEGARGAPGYNHSIRYKNYLVHVQTEDAGARQAAVFTHVFVGGCVVGARRASYAERLGEADLDACVRRLVYEQHRATFLALRGGEFDIALERVAPLTENRTSGIVRRAESFDLSLSTAPPPSSSPWPSPANASPLPTPLLRALTPVPGPLTSIVPRPGPRAPLAPVPSPRAPSVAPAAGTCASSAAPMPGPPAPSAAPTPGPLAPSAAPPSLPSTTPPTPTPPSATPPPPSSSFFFPPAVSLPSSPPASIVGPRSPSSLPPALGLRSLLTSLLPSSERPSFPPTSRAPAAAGVPPSGRPSSPPSLRVRVLSERPLAPLPLALRALDGYRASGVVDLTNGKLLVSDGLVGTAALIASLREVVAGHNRSLAALAIEDNAAEYLLLGGASCLLLRGLPSRPGVYVYVACDQGTDDLGPARQALGEAVDELG